MRDGGRLAAAIEVLTEIETRHKPAKLALKAWGDSARYAGSKDRAWVSGLVLDALRRRRSLGWMMGGETARAVALAALRYAWDWPLERIAEAAADETHGPGALSDEERAALERPSPLRGGVGGGGVDSELGSEHPHPPTPSPQGGGGAPIRGDYPDWLDPYFERVFGEDRAEELAALATRAPVDLRVNTLKTDPARALKALEPLGAVPAGVLPTAIRIAAPAASERAGAVETIPAFSKGWFEVQDLGSQIAAAAAGEIKGKQVLDYCAGGGGKTLALAAAMGSTGQIYAHDSDARRLADTIRRAERAGVRNLQIRSPVKPNPLAGLEAKMDVVFVDAPCTGSGTWRRHPDAKWRLTPEQLIRRQAEQDKVLDGAAPFVKPGGRLIYVTCSLLMEENEDRIAAFLARTPGFASNEAPLRLTPLRSGTDGFFIAVLERTP